jgi:long-chain acyl-CoA synthetase
MLIRAETPEKARLRGERVLSFLRERSDAGAESWRSRVEIVRGDLRAADLGLEAAVRDALVGDLTHIVHTAADTRFELPAAELRSINVEGTRRIVGLARLARKQRLKRLVFVSTAYVCGNRGGVIAEDRADDAQGFANDYEHSKWLAEQVLFDDARDVPWTIVRPTSVLGSSRTGRMLSSRALGIGRLIARRTLRWHPRCPNFRYDVVPSDYVADAILRSMQLTEAESRCLHLAQGEAAATFEESFDRFRRTLAALGVRTRGVRYIPGWLFRAALSLAAALPGKGAAAFAKYRVYLPYLNIKRTFATEHTLRLLEPAVKLPAPETYFERVMRVAIDNDWRRIDV